MLLFRPFQSGPYRPLEVNKSISPQGVNFILAFINAFITEEEKL